MPWAAVIGSPIEHSLSPVIHRAAWDSIGLGEEWIYKKIHVDADDAEKFVRGVDDQCRGLSVTMPCKQRILRALDAVDPLAEAVGACNTVIPSAGILTGFNTDVHGIVSAINQARHARGCGAATTALILGSRATASSALAALGSLGITRIQVAARQFAGPGSIVAASMRLGVSIEHILWSDTQRVQEAAHGADILMSTLPAGVADDFARVLTPRSSQTLLDVVYSPRQTPLRATFERAGAIIAEGTDMLLYQAALQVQLMTGYEPDIEHMRRALQASF